MTEEEVKYYSVTQYNKAIKNYLDEIDALRDVHIKGEISNYRGATRGHLYFTLKDETSRINVVMFSTAAAKLEFVPKDGDEVLIDGRITVYEANGGYQVYAEKMTLAGNGDLLKKLEELKKKLQAEGLFDESHKRPIPKYPERIGIVTAPNKAAIKDILSTIKRRYPLCETILFPALVQGDLAKESIVKQIEEANDPKYNLDTLIVGRGGGSIEDLWAFNEEIVARAIYNSRVPVISAVGHEIDFTIADFVADLRAPTPTGAAEMAVPNLADLLNTISQYKIRLNNNITGSISYLKDMLKKLSTSYVLSNPLATFEIREQKLDELVNRLNTNLLHKLDVSKNRFDSIKTKRVLLHPEDMLIKYNNSMELVINKLELLNPLNVLKKGYSVTKVNDKSLKSIKDVKEKDKLNIKIIDGEIDAIVEGVK
jgi:exodeoxyribonuclease VII large subunit